MIKLNQTNILIDIPKDVENIPLLLDRSFVRLLRRKYVDSCD